MQEPISSSQPRSLLRDTRGLSTVEYVIILAIVAIGAIGVWQTFGEAVTAQVGNAATGLGTLPTSAANQ
jgi:Flp pilus assembly pilin Flp